MIETLKAKLENRTFSLLLTEQKPNENAIDMYNTPYRIVKNDSGWQNHNSNKMDMSLPLISAVLQTLNTYIIVAK